MPRKALAEKEKKRRTVAKAAIAGKGTKITARIAGCTQRHVTRLLAEPATQFLITDAFRPLQKKLRAMAKRAVQVVEQGFSAMRYVKAGKDDYRLHADAIARLKAVERYGDLLELAQGKPSAEVEQQANHLVTWEEFLVLYRKRTEQNGNTEAAEPQQES